MVIEMNIKEIRSLSVSDMVGKLSECRKELACLVCNKKIDDQQAFVKKRIALKKTIARLLTVINQRRLCLL